VVFDGVDHPIRIRHLGQRLAQIADVQRCAAFHRARRRVQFPGQQP